MLTSKSVLPDCRKPLTTILTLGIITSAGLVVAARSIKASASYETPWTAAQIITIDALAKKLNSSDKPVVLQIGIESLYKSSHIPGSIFAGPAMDADGLKKLRDAAAKIPRTQSVVIYCGCCPFKDCPNVKPAFTALKQMGFKKLLVLEIPSGFGPDWVSKGLPVEH